MEFRILGPLAVHSDAGPVALGGSKRRALMAMLLLHPNVSVSAERLAIALWGEDAAAEAVKTVRVHVSRVRASLGDSGRLVTTAAGYQLRVLPGELDAECFERRSAQGRRALADGLLPRAEALLDEALALWRGLALPDLRDEPFARVAVARLEELRWDTIEARNDANLRLGRLERVVAGVDAVAGTTPMRERLVEQRMRALYGLGRQVEALAVYRDAQRLLRDELGLEPGPALRDLQRAVLAHDRSLTPASHPRPDLPWPATATIARERLVATVARMLGESRLVTLTGPGGVGKTRVAMDMARAAADGSGGTVHIAWLARAAAATDVLVNLARVLDAAAHPGEHLEDALARRLVGRDALLVLDNVEHVLAAAPLFARLLERCPGLRLLATSREPLGLPGERCLLVEPLTTPDSIRLFLARARDRRPGFELTEANASAITELCTRLDGLPLALELAAGRIELMEPDQLVARLGDSLSLLAGGPADAAPHQRTMRTTLEWSAALLDESERHAFLALSVCVGGADLDAAEAVTGAHLKVLDALVAKSLVRVQDGRLAELEVVRQFAEEAFADAPEAVGARRRHAEHYLRLAEQLGADAQVTGRGPAFWRLQRELGNLRVATAHWLAQGDGDRALRMSAALEPYWSLTSRYGDGVRALEAALKLESRATPRARGRARLATSRLQRRMDTHAGFADARSALELARAADDVEGQCMALDELAYRAMFAGDFGQHAALVGEQQALAESLDDPFLLASALMRRITGEPGNPGLREARTLADQAAPLLRRCGSRRRIAEMMVGLVSCALDEADYEVAEDLAAQALKAAEDIGDPFQIQVSLGNAGVAALFRERVDMARRHFHDQLEICRREHLEVRWAEPVFGLAAVAVRAGDFLRAATLLGAAEPCLRRHVAEADQILLERLREQFFVPARAAADASGWTRAEAAGAALACEQLFDLALDAPDGLAIMRQRATPPSAR
ncbi:MAG: hypothetical protein QOC91_1378 [Solirubrobacteraceae bacterium]|nr:hypothetical protein [Solirubrobacteraceae bacterium]